MMTNESDLVNGEPVAVEHKRRRAATAQTGSGVRAGAGRHGRDGGRRNQPAPCGRWRPRATRASRTPRTDKPYDGGPVSDGRTAHAEPRTEAAQTAGVRPRERLADGADGVAQLLPSGAPRALRGRRAQPRRRTGQAADAGGVQRAQAAEPSDGDGDHDYALRRAMEDGDA